MTSATVYICLLSQRGPHEEIRPAGSLFSTSPLSLPLLLYLSSLSLCRGEGRRGGAGPAGAAAARPPDPAGAGGEARRWPSRQIWQGREGRCVAEPAGAAAVARPPDPAGAGGEARWWSGYQIRQGRGEGQWRTTDLEPWRAAPLPPPALAGRHLHLQLRRRLPRLPATNATDASPPVVGRPRATAPPSRPCRMREISSGSSSSLRIGGGCRWSPRGGGCQIWSAGGSGSPDLEPPGSYRCLLHRPSSFTGRLPP
ncbi:hypothetical protein DAI22_04g034601 [Oryza sativa Japonica Group]|nr:hypothetical protein DAI22_04g034601 [Oryza sativa Japonica Group]